MRISTFLLTLAVPVLVFAHGKAPAAIKTEATTTTESTTTTASTSGGSKVEINVDGMHCQSCVDNLTKQLEAINDVEKGSVKVDLKGNKAMLTLKKGSKDASSIDALKKTLNAKLEGAGFTVTDVKTIN